MNVEQLVEVEFTGEAEVLKKIHPSAAVSTTDSTLPDLGSNLGNGSGKPASDCLHYGMALLIMIIQ
jgi:hypothetical protein